MTFSYRRELETYNQCNRVLLAIADLEYAVRAAPRLTLKQEAKNADALKSIQQIYRNLQNNCAKNL
jgi:hypothetical protein